MKLKSKRNPDSVKDPESTSDVSNKVHGNLPKKTTLNLYIKPNYTRIILLVSSIVVVTACLLTVFGKFAIYDIWKKTKEIEDELKVVQLELEVIQNNIVGYDEIANRYHHYAPTTEELSLVDRIEILTLLDGVVRSTANMGSVSISKNIVNLQFSGVTLAKTADIVRELENSPLVSSIEVNTAATTNNKEASISSNLVQVTLLIHLQKEVQDLEEVKY